MTPDELAAAQAVTGARAYDIRARGRFALAGGPAAAPGASYPDLAPAASALPQIVLPPDQFMPITAAPFYAQDSQALTGPTTWTPAAAIRTTLPGDNVGVIKDFFVTISNMLTTTLVSWALRVNGSAVIGNLGNLTTPVTAAAFISSPGFNGQLSIRVPQGGTVDVLVTIADGGTYTVGASYFGWFYARSLYDQYARLTGG